MNWVRAYASSVRSGSAPPASHSLARAFRRPGRAPLHGLPLRMDPSALEEMLGDNISDHFTVYVDSKTGKPLRLIPGR